MNSDNFPIAIGTPFSCIRIVSALALDKAKDKNFVFSPCLIHLAIGLLANGSTGSTLKELLAFSEAKTLTDLNSVATEIVSRLSNSTEKSPKFSFISGIWVDRSLSLNPNFKTVIEGVYKGKADTLDFGRKAKEVMNEVNEWAESATNGLIKSLVSENLFNERTRLVLANALYFKGKWERNTFKASNTEKSAFYLLDGMSVTVPFMTNRYGQFVKVYEDFKVLRIPYEENSGDKQAISFHIILPNEINGLSLLSEKLGSDPSLFNEYVGNNTEKIELLEFMIPKFNITYEAEASEILKGVGLQLSFSDKPEFSEMVQNLDASDWLKVSKVLHKSSIEVNEEGTEAVAAGSQFWDLEACCDSPDSDVTVNFVADHPFIFAVRDEKSGMVLFMGHVINPSLE
ncbi:hypothetical protein ACHQM5_023451 [Ranunculus cassubicifolius]